MLVLKSTNNEDDLMQDGVLTDAAARDLIG
jgi:hypothetical protein